MCTLQKMLWVSRAVQSLYAVALVVTFIIWKTGYINSDFMITMGCVGLILIFVSKTLKAIARQVNHAIRFGNGLTAGGWGGTKEEVPLLDVETFGFGQ